MTTHLADGPAFTPPPTRGLVRALALAILAHAVLLAALTWGVRWKRDAEVSSVQAELWASVPVQAAPAAVPPPPPPSPAPEAPAPKVEAAPAPKADIAVERARERKAAAERAEQQNRERQRQAEERRQQQEKDRARAQAEQRQRQAELQRAQAQREQQEAARLDAQRKANLARIAGMAGATGAATATGSAAQSAGPSASYAGRVIARIKPNIVFTDTVPGNPTALVEVRTAPDGTIVGRRLLRPSGHRGWDEAVMKALDKTETLPRDTDERVPPVLEISFKVQD